MSNMTPQVAQERFAWHPKVACRTVDGIAFILLESRMLSLDTVGTRIWEWLEFGASIQQVAQHVTQKFDVSFEQAKDDTSHFVNKLYKQQLLVHCDAENNEGTGLGQVEEHT